MNRPLAARSRPARAVPMLLLAAPLALLISPRCALAAGADSIDVSSTLEEIRACRSGGRYGEASALAERLLERFHGDESAEPDKVVEIEWLARTMRFAAALPRAEQEELARGDSLDRAIRDAYNAGEYAAAAEAAAAQLAVRKRILGEDHPYVAPSLNNLALMLESTGRYAEAEPIYREALAMYRRIYGDGYPSVAGIQHNLAYLLLAQGKYAQAEPLFREAVALIANLLGENHPVLATTLNCYGEVLDFEGRSAEAESSYRKALDMRRELLGDDSPSVAATLHDLAHLLRERGSRDEAEALYADALRRRRSLLGDDHPLTAATMSEYAELLIERGRPGEAEPLLTEALESRRRFLGREHPHVAQSLTALARLHLSRGDYGAASERLEEAARVYETARRRAGRGIERSTFQRSPYELLAATRLLLGEPEDAWPLAEKSLARYLADLMRAAEQRRLLPDEEAREDSLAGALDRLERKLAALRARAAAAPTDSTSVEMERARVELLAAEATWSAFQSEMAEKHPVTEGETASIEEVRSALGEGAALVGWVDVERTPGEYLSWIYVIRGEGPVAWRRLPDDPDSAGDAPDPYASARSYRAGLVQRDFPVKVLEREARELYRRRIAPAADRLEDLRELVVIPSGAMAGIPVETLIDEEGAPLGDRFVLSYTPSATLLARLAGRGPPPAGRKARSLLVADPPFNEAHREAMADEELPGFLRKALSILDRDAARGVLDGDARTIAELPRLPASRREARTIAALLPSPSLLLGAEASEQSISRLAEKDELRSFRVIHFATHALVDDEQPERSALVLSQVDLPEPLDAALAGERIYDGLLRVREIGREWALDADLVTLSACETGLGRKVHGEGYVGFAHAFLQAGARSMLVSLWKVSDHATALLMERFYENYTGEAGGGARGGPMGKAAALREAKRWLRAYGDDGNRPYEHPRYWSAFVLIGDRGARGRSGAD